MKKITKVYIFALILAAVGVMSVSGVSAKDSDGDVVIVIDAGHGGDDPGSISANNNAREKDCNLAIAMAMKEELGKYDGVKVYMTRTGDEWITNSGRAMIAASLNADFLISIHNNSGSETNSGCIGYRSLNKLYEAATTNMCTLITDNLAALGFANGGVQTRVSTQFDYEDYYTLIAEGVRAGVPSVIIEHCFLSNAEDEARLTNSDGSVNQEMAAKMGKADAAAVVQYFGLSERTTPADSTTELFLTSGNSVRIQIPNSTGDGAVWRTSDSSVVSVDDAGIAKAVGTGTANVTYSLSDGTTGYAVITVPEIKAVTLTGAINPTFYDDVEDIFSDIDLSKAFGIVTYSDGTAENVRLDSVGNADTTKVGTQYVDIAYGNLKGRLMVCHNNAEYVPEVTEPAPTEAYTEPESTEQATKEPETKTSEDDKDGTTKGLIKFVAILLVLVIIAIILVIVERNRKSRRWRRR